MAGHLLTAAEVAEFLNVPESWVREQTRNGARRGNGMPHLRLGRYVRFEEDAVRDWLADQRSGRWRKHRPEVRGLE